tara:strand:- start:4108 stop:4884 length:777 start_codon:yes stop_codon:yes gene_type:complete
MISLYTTAFNLNNFDFCFKQVFENWFYYVDEVVVSTLENQVEEIKTEINKTTFSDRIKIVSTDLDPNKDLYWDGRLKDAGLKACSHNFVIQLDLDERISGSKYTLKELFTEINRHDFPCSIMLPTIDLYEDVHSFVNIGYKWYIHTRDGTNRGSVNFSLKNDGTFDPEKSDTCELIDDQGQLIPCIGRVSFAEHDPKIIHLGYLNLEDKNNINKNFWGKIWHKRKTGIDSPDFEPEEVKSGDPRKQPHNLPMPLWPSL